MPVTNDLGQVALQHINSNPITIQVGEKFYSFVPRYNISMAWIDAEDVDRVMARKTNSCCGNAPRSEFLYVGENNAHLWETGERLV